jgi:AcrR family transcriptional regulator
MAIPAPQARSNPPTGDGPPPRATPTRTRATALPAEERRSAIVAAAIPLLLTHGLGVTTRQIAQAAGIAEGTIFRVFRDKESLIAAVVETAFDPGPVEAAVDAIDRDLPLAERLTQAVDILQRRVTSIWSLMSAVGISKPPVARPAPPSLTGIAALFEPDRDRLRRTPESSAQILRGLTIGSSHPGFIMDEALTPAEIVSILLDGLLTPEGRARP